MLTDKPSGSSSSSAFYQKQEGKRGMEHKGHLHHKKEHNFCFIDLFDSGSYKVATRKIMVPIPDKFSISGNFNLEGSP